MIDNRIKLTILHDDNSSFTDYSNSMVDFLRDDETISLVSAEDYIYIGYRKAFQSVYCEFTTANTIANEFSAEIYDGTSWVSIEIYDETKGFERSGFITWDKSSMASTTINSIDKYYIRLKPSVDHSATAIRGMNLIFADDAAMKSEFFEIDNANLLPPSEASHISTHVATKNHIIQSLRNLGYIKTSSAGSEDNVDQWDLHDIYEIRQAATMLSLSKIFFTLSDAVEDHWWAKYREYQDKFEEAFKLSKLSLDSDDDGVEDVDEKRRAFKSQRWGR